MPTSEVTPPGSALHEASVNLDLLRSVAVLLVLFSHIPPPLGYESGAWAAMNNIGHFGVLIFFIHTSLVLMMSLERSQCDGPALIRRFYIRRAFRIYPLSVFTVLVMGFFVPLFAGARCSGPGTLDFWSNVLLMQNLTHSPPTIGPLWSLPYEVQMYLVLPFIYFLGKRYGRARLWVPASAVVWYVCRRYDLAWDLLTYLPWFVMGAAAYFLPLRIRFPHGTYYLAVILLTSIPTGWAIWIGGHGLAMVELASCWLFAAALPGFPDISSKPVAIVCHYVAKYSYGIYLAHFPILWLTLPRTALPLVLRVGACACLLVVAPVVLYWSIEHPGIKLGGRIARKLLPG